jgi:prepilin-type N-terminal cleavage/methylation domain-containing protein
LRYGARGWTLVELVIVLVIMGVLAYVVVRSLRPGEAQALQQAERLRDDLRYTQMLAMNQGRAKQLKLGAPASPASCAGSAYYVIDCTAGGTDPCTAAPNNAIADARQPGGFFCVSLPDGLALGGADLYFDPLGRPKTGAALIAANATFTISGGGTQRSAVVTPLTGFATAQ